MLGNVLFLLSFVSILAVAQAEKAAGTDPVFRAPFVLRLSIDNEHYYEEHFDRVPFVADNDVYLFSGEDFGINIAISKDEVTGIRYEKNAVKADVEFRFTQEKLPNGLMMMLVIRNRLKRKLFFDALMTIPEKKEIRETSILPVGPLLTNYESWRHPIVQLVLRNFRFSEVGEQQSGR